MQNDFRHFIGPLNSSLSALNITPKMAVSIMHMIEACSLVLARCSAPLSSNSRSHTTGNSKLSIPCPREVLLAVVLHKMTMGSAASGYGHNSKAHSPMQHAAQRIGAFIVLFVGQEREKLKHDAQASRTAPVSITVAIHHIPREVQSSHFTAKTGFCVECVHCLALILFDIRHQRTAARFVQQTS